MTSFRRSARLRLALGTALAGGTLAMAPAARAQELPGGGVVVAGAAGIDTNMDGSGMDVRLVGPATVINWNSFNVVDAGVNFRQVTSLLPTGVSVDTNAVVVNRVVGTGGVIPQSQITNGRITTTAGAFGTGDTQNTTVYLLNPSGVLIGGGSAISTGSFLASTLDVCPTGPAGCTSALDMDSLALGTALAGTDPVRLYGPDTTTIPIRVTGGSSIGTRDALVLVAGAVDIDVGTTLSAGGDVHLVAATDVMVRRPGSPLVMQINAGSRVAADLVRTAGGITGDSVVVAAARPDGLMEQMLSVGGTVVARGVASDARGVVLLGGAEQTVGAGDPPLPAPDRLIAFGPGLNGPVGVTTTGRLTTIATDVIVNASGAATVGGDVSAARDYLVAGSSVALGTAGATTQQRAGGVVTVRSAGAGIAGDGTLTLNSNSQGATGGALTLASAGGILFDGASSIIGGTSTAAGNADIRISESGTATETRFGAITGRSLGRITDPADPTPQPLTLYGSTALGTVTLDRALDLRIANGGGGQVGTLSAASFLIGANAADNGGGSALVDDLRVTAAGDLGVGSAQSLTGSVILTATDGDVTGQQAGAYSFVTAASGIAAAPGVLGVSDGNVGIYAGRSDIGVQTGTRGTVRLAGATAGNDVRVLAQKIEAGTIRAAAPSDAPVPGTAPGGSVTLHAYGHDTTANAIDLRVGSVEAGTNAAPRGGQDILLVADAAGGTIAVGSLLADRDITVSAGNGDGVAAIAGDVAAGRRDPIGIYSVAAGRVTLGGVGDVTQSAAAAVTIRSTATDIEGLGQLTLQSNRDGTATEALTLNAARAIAFDGASRLFAGDGSATGSSDLLVYESGTADSASFGQVRARRLGSVGGGATLFLYGRTTFGDVTLDRSLNLYVGTGAGGSEGSLTTGALRLGVNPTDDGAGTAVADTLSLYTAGSARFASVTSDTGALSITANDGDVSGLLDPASGRLAAVSLTAARGGTAGALAIGDSGIDVFAGRNGSGGQTATGTAGLARLGDVTAGAGIRVDAQAIAATLVDSNRGGVALTAGAADGSVTNAPAEVLTAGTVRSGLRTGLAATAGSVRVGTVEAGRIALPGSAAGAVRIDGFGNVRIGVATPTTAVPGGVTSVLGDVAIEAQHGDVTGVESGSSFGAANLSAFDGNVSVNAVAQAIGSTPVGLVRLGQVLARTSETFAGATTLPERGNIRIVGRVVDVVAAETARTVGGVVAGASGGGSLYLQARQGSDTDDVHLALGTGSVGTSATLIAGTGLLRGSTGPNGTVSVGSLEAGRNRLIDNGLGRSVPGTITIDAVNAVLADTLATGTGSVRITATNGDVGALTIGGRPSITAAVRPDPNTGTLPIDDGRIDIAAASPLANRGRVTLGAIRAGSTVAVAGRAIDAAGQTVQSVTGSVSLLATAGDLAVGTVDAGGDIVLGAAFDPQTVRGPGNVTANTLRAGRSIGVDADATAAITDDVTAGTGGSTGYYRVTARGDVVLGSDATEATLADTDIQTARDDLSIVAGGDIRGARGLVLRSNSAGMADGIGAADGVRELTLDAGRAVSLSLPDGLTITARDAVATQLIGGNGSDTVPYQSAVRVRAGANTVMTLGSVSARALRGIGATTVDPQLAPLAERAGASPLVHAGDIRLTRVDVVETLGILAGGGGVDRLLQIDSALVRGRIAADPAPANIALGATGALRGYALGLTGTFVPTILTAQGRAATDPARIDVRVGSALLNTLRANDFVGVRTSAGALRVDTVTTRAAGPAGRGIALTARTDLRLTSAIAAAGDVLAQADTGSVTGLPNPDDGSTAGPFARVATLVATNGNLAVNALGAGAGTGLIDAAVLSAGSDDVPAIGAPARGNLTATGQRIVVDTATATPGSLSVVARPGSGVSVDTAVLLGTASAGTTATVRAVAGTGSVAGEGNGTIRVGTVTGGTNAISASGTEAIRGDVTLTASGSVRVNRAASATGSVRVTATNGDVTGLDAVAGRAILSAATARIATSTAPAIANGAIDVSATGTDTGLVRLDTLTAGGGIAIRARTVDARGTVRAGDAITTAGDILIESQNGVRIDAAETSAGSVSITARDGDVTGLLAADGTYGRTRLTAGGVSGNIGVYAGRTSADPSIRTATGSNGRALLGAVTAANTVRILAEAIDATRVEATAGSIDARAYAADRDAPGGEALVLVDALSGAGASLNSDGGGVRTRLVEAGRTTAGDIGIVAARSVRVGTARTAAGSIAVTARGAVAGPLPSGDVTGLANATGFDGTILIASAPTGDLAVYAGRSGSTGARTSATENAMALIASGSAGRHLTVLAQTLDAGSLLADRGTLNAHTFAGDPAGATGSPESLRVVTAGAGLGATLSSAGSVGATTVNAGLRRSGVAGDLFIDAARNVRLGVAAGDASGSGTGNVTIAARGGDVTATTLNAATARIAEGPTLPRVADGNLAISATPSAAVTGSGVVTLGRASAGNDVTIRGARIAAGVVQAAAISDAPVANATPGGSVTIEAFGQNTGATPDLFVDTVAAGTDTSARRGLNVVLTASAADGTLVARTIGADGNVVVNAGRGSAGSATIGGAVAAGRSIPAAADAAGGSYSVTAGSVTLGSANTAVVQRASGAVAITSTAAATGVGDITGLGALTLQSNSDGSAARETLTLNAARGISLPAASLLLGGLDPASNPARFNSDILVAEGPAAAGTAFGAVRGRSLGGLRTGSDPAPTPLTLYGPTTFGTVDLDRSLTLTVANGGAGQPGTLTTGAVTLGRNPSIVGGVAVPDTLTLTTAGSARLGPVLTGTGSLSITAIDGDVSGSTSTDRLQLTAANAAANPQVADGSITVRAARDATGGTTGLALLGTVSAGGAVSIDAQAIDAMSVLAARGALALTARARDGVIANALGQALTLGTGNAGLTATLTAAAGSVAASIVNAGQFRNGTAGDLAIVAARNVRLNAGASLTGSVAVTARDGDVTGVSSGANAFGRTDLTAAIATAAVPGAAGGSGERILDGGIGVYAGRDANGAQTAITRDAGFARLGLVRAGDGVTVLAQRIDTTAVQAAASNTGSVARVASGSATLTAYAHTPGGVDLQVGSVNAAEFSAARPGRDVTLTAAGEGGTIRVGTINADRTVTVAAGTDTNGAATISGAVDAGRGDRAGAYLVRSGQVTLGTANGAVTQRAAAATTVTARAGAVTGLGTLLLQSNSDGVGAEALEVTATGGAIDAPATTLRGGPDGINGSAVSAIATGSGAGIDLRAIDASGSTALVRTGGPATLRGAVTAAAATVDAGTTVDLNGAVRTTGATTIVAGGAITTAGTAPITAAVLSVTAGGTVTTNAAITAPITTIQAVGGIAIGGTLAATTAATLRSTGGSVTTTAALGTPTLLIEAGDFATSAGAAVRAGRDIAIGGPVTTTTARLRAAGRVSATSSIAATTALTVQSSQIVLAGAVSAPTVGLYNQSTAANPTQLGGAATGDAAGFGLDAAELARVTAGTLIVGSGADDVGGSVPAVGWLQQDVTIGTLPIGAGTGSTALRVVATGANQAITVNGAVSMNGATASGAPGSRTLQIGGAAGTVVGEAGRLLIVNEGAGSTVSGSITTAGVRPGDPPTGGGVLDLRARQVLAGRDAFIQAALASPDVSRDLVSRPDSALYGASTRSDGRDVFLSPVELVTTGQLRLQFSNYALLQNTSRAGAIPTGVTITGLSSGAADAQPLVLRSGTAAQSNGFALFGRFQPYNSGQTFFSTQAALLGPTYISNGATANGGVNPVAARLNGCLLSSAGGGCLVSSIAQPTLNVFDVTRDQVLRGSDDLLVAFDPLVGSNNEALFGDIAAGDQPFDLQPCVDGTPSAQCKPTGTVKP